MKLESRLTYLAFLIIGIFFIIVGFALDELDVIDAINQNSVTFEDNLDSWYRFLLPWVGDSNNGLPPPWR